MNKFLLVSFLLAAFIAVTSARPEPDIIAWHETEEGIAGSVRVPRGIGNVGIRKPNCMCIIADNCPCRNGGNQRGTGLEGMLKNEN